MTIPAPEDRPLRIVALASGSGTLVQSLMDNLDPTRVELLAVGADRHCTALERADRGGVEKFLVEYTSGETDRRQWNKNLADEIERWHPDLVVSAGFMRILGEEVINRFPGKIINTHPALLPAFPGAHAVDDALEYGVKITGSTVHIVDAGVDTGPIVAQQSVKVLPGDKVDTLHERIKQVERTILVDVLHTIAKSGLTIEGRKALISDHD